MAALYNEIRDLLIRASGIPARVGGLLGSWMPGGRSIGIPRIPNFSAKLTSGSGAAGYTFRRQVRKAGGTWGDLTVADEPLAKAYEFNKSTVPIGKVVMLRDVGIAGEYRFPFVRVGTAVQCPQGWYTLTVSGCGKTMPGQDVQLLKGGVVVGTFTTDANGKAALVPSGPITDQYQWRITRVRYFPVTSLAFTAFCNTNVSTTITPNTNVYTCSPCDPFVPQKKTLFMTCGIGPYTMTYSTGIWNSGGSYTLVGSCPSFGDTGTVSFSLRCTGNGVILLTTNFSLCEHSNSIFGRTTINSSFGNVVSTAAPRNFDVNQPINLTYSWPGDFTHAYSVGGIIPDPTAPGRTYPNFGTIAITE